MKPKSADPVTVRGLWNTKSSNWNPLILYALVTWELRRCFMSWWSLKKKMCKSGTWKESLTTNLKPWASFFFILYNRTTVEQKIWPFTNLWNNQSTAMNSPLYCRPVHCKFFPHKKVQGILVSQNITCKVHVIITGITCTPEIPAKIIRKFEKS